MFVNLFRGADLFDGALVHYDQTVGQRHALMLVMGDENAGCANGVVDAADLVAHLHAQLGIKVRQRFVKEEHLGLADYGAGHGDALPLATGQLSGFTIQELDQTHRSCRRFDPRHPLGLGHARHLQRIADVLGHRHVRV